MSNNFDAYSYATIVCGAMGGVVSVYVILSCLFGWKKSSAPAINESSDGYQDIRETGRRRALSRYPFRKQRKQTVANGSATQADAAFRLSTRLGSAPTNSRLQHFPSGPLPVLPPTSSDPSIPANGLSHGLTTRESSTSELYATVDRNPTTTADGAHGGYRTIPNGPSGGIQTGIMNENDEHTYSKIRPPPGTYDEIDDDAAISAASAASCSKRRSAPIPPFLLTAGCRDVDLLYSQAKETGSRAAESLATKSPAPPPVPRLPPKRASHPYDYPKFLNNDNRGSTAPTNPSSRDIYGDDDGQTTAANNNGDGVYSKIESQYGGSEDPYSSIKSSEEHYSSVVPNSNRNENSIHADAPLPHMHGRLGTVPAYSSVRPKSARFIYPRRSKSYSEEYSVIQKPSAKQQQQYDESGDQGQGSSSSAAISGIHHHGHYRAPPVPEKRYPAVPYNYNHREERQRSPPPAVGGTSHDPNYGQLPRRDGIINGDPGIDHQHTAGAAENGSEAKREPNYRFITVRESLDVLRARMEAAATANTPAIASEATPTAAVPSRQADSSLHYYATISENSYEVVPTRSGSEDAQQEELVNSVARRVSYIDDDDDDDNVYETGIEEYIHSPDSSSRQSDAATVRKLESGASSNNTLMSTSVHSHTGSHTTSGSHVTLVHVGSGVGAGGSAPSTSAAAGCTIRPTDRWKIDKSAEEQEDDDEKRRRKLKDTEGRRPQVGASRLGSSDDSTCSTGAALSIDIESINFGGVDENLSTIDQRDLINPSTTDEYVEGCSRSNSNNFDIIKDNRGIRNDAKSPEIVDLETLENFNVSCNSLNSGGGGVENVQHIRPGSSFLL